MQIAISSTLTRHAQRLAAQRLAAKYWPAKVLQLTCPALAILLLMFSHSAVCAQPDIQGHVIRDQPLKAAYLYNFAKFITLPEEYLTEIDDAENSITIGIVGESAVENHLQTIAGRRTVNGKTLKVKKFERAADLQACHMVFLPAGMSRKETATAIDLLEDYSAFVVSESPQLLESVHASFYIEENRIKFEINLTKVDSEHAKLSSNLLRLGKLVRFGQK